MATIKSYTDIEQSKKLAEILPLESADMTLPFRHSKKDEYIPGYVVSRNYVEVYNEMMKLPAMEKEDVCKLIQPSWSLAALLNYLSANFHVDIKYLDNYWELDCHIQVTYNEELVDACVAMIIKLSELKVL